MRELAIKVKTVLHGTVPFFEEGLRYQNDVLCDMFHLGRELMEDIRNASDDASDEVKAAIAEKLDRYQAMAASLTPIEGAPEKIYLWPEGKMPTSTVYTENLPTQDRYFNHDPEFKPFMYAVLQPEEVTPKGALVLCAGGDHGDCIFQEVIGSIEDLKPLGYQLFILSNRVNLNPWNRQDVGADTARAIRYIRAHAAEYRIDPNKVAFAGFSNGGLTGEDCIEYYSGAQTVKDSYPDYEPDELDNFKGAPDAFLCIYGPRWAGAPFKWEGVEYPPTFFAIGREDSAIDNFNYVYPQLLERGVPVEIHTFAGVPHGQAGVRMLGEKRFQTFHLWIPLAEAFLADVFK